VRRTQVDPGEIGPLLEAHAVADEAISADEAPTGLTTPGVSLIAAGTRV
jgi:hypothetical protein